MREEELRFFNQDESDHEEKKFNFPDYNIKFRIGLFLEFFFYHYVFYTFGPLSFLFFYKKPGLKLMRNMKFYGEFMGL